MDKTIAYDEPLDPHWERLNALGPSLDQMLEGLEDKSANNRIRHHSRENVVPFMTRQLRALEMRRNIDRAILDGHFEKFPDLDGVAIEFGVFAEKAGELGSTVPKTGGQFKDRDGLLQIFHLAWEKLRTLERDGFPLMDYVGSPALDGPEIVGTLVIEKLPDGTMRVKHETLPDEPGVS
jgi:hypothetical protein